MTEYMGDRLFERRAASGTGAIPVIANTDIVKEKTLKPMKRKDSSSLRFYPYIWREVEHPAFR